MAITTENCKEFLVNHFPGTVAKEWKRLSKYKTADVWHREFLHPAMGTVVLEERNNKLFINTGNAIKSATAINAAKSVKSSKKSIEVVQKTFSATETQGARELVAEYLALDDKDELFTSDQWTKYAHALPSQFTFCFPEDTYGNTLDNVSNGINTTMEFPSDGYCDAFNVMFEDMAGSDLDLYAHDCLREAVLPAWTSFVDEYHLQPSGGPKGMTVLDFFTLLVNLGFTYQSDNYYPCLFSKELDKIKIKGANSVEGTSQLKEGAALKQILQSDNSEKLMDLIKNGMDVNRIVPGEMWVIVEAVKNQAQACFDTLLNSGASLWLENTNGLTVGKAILIENPSSFYVDKTLGTMLKEPTTDLFEKCQDIVRHTSNIPQILDFVKQLLPESDVNKILVNCAGNLIENHKVILLDAIKKCDEHTIREKICEEVLHDNFIRAQWIIQHSGIDKKTLVIEYDSKGKQVRMDVKTFIALAMAEAQMESIRLASRGGMIVYQYSNGHRESDIEIFNNKMKPLKEFFNYLSK